MSVNLLQAVEFNENQSDNKKSEVSESTSNSSTDMNFGRRKNKTFFANCNKSKEKKETKLVVVKKDETGVKAGL